MRSRFEGAEGGVKAFVDTLKQLGLECRQLDQSNKMFVMMEFRKAVGGAPVQRDEDDSGGGRKANKPAPFAAKVSEYLCSGVHSHSTVLCSAGYLGCMDWSQPAG